MISHIRRLARHFTPSMMVACTAVFLACAGTSFGQQATAAASHLITGKQIKNNAITTAKVKNSSLTGADIRDGTITAKDLAKGLMAPTPSIAGPKGDAGAQGTQGASGAKGDPGQAGDKGVSGPQGASGLNGRDGDKGDPGLADLETVKSAMLTIPAHTDVTAIATCPFGKVAISGGFATQDASLNDPQSLAIPMASGPIPDGAAQKTAWQVIFGNPFGASVRGQAWAVCATTP